MLRFENYCTQPVELGPDGLPRRSSHGGYDLKSVRAAAEARGGTLTLHWENEWFTLRVLLPPKMTNRYVAGRLHNQTRINLGKTRRKFPARFAIFLQSMHQNRQVMQKVPYFAPALLQ